MDINELLKGVDCACGRHHDCDIEAVYIEKSAIRHLTDLCRAYTRILVVADENTFAAAGQQTMAAIEGKTVETVLFGREILVPDEKAVRTVTDALGQAELIIGIGSGVIQDLCKYVSHVSELPYMVVATAPSMDGYASNGAAMIAGGMKVTYAAGLPRALVADTDILKNAPLEMIKAGYGDIIGKFSALNDWKLSHAVTGEYFCQYIYDLTYDQIKKTLSLAEGILQRNEESVKALMEALMIIGILMSFAGSSRPASGSEHHLSHFFEITGIVDEEPYLPHGIDVAYSTVITAGLREEILAKPFPGQQYCPAPAVYKEKMTGIYKAVAAGCMALQEKTGYYTRDFGYQQKEHEIRAILSEMPTAAQIEKMLNLGGLEMDAFYRFYTAEKIENAKLYAKDLKDRYTVLWIYYAFQ